MYTRKEILRDSTIDITFASNNTELVSYILTVCNFCYFLHLPTLIFCH